MKKNPTTHRGILAQKILQELPRYDPFEEVIQETKPSRTTNRTLREQKHFKKKKNIND